MIVEFPHNGHEDRAGTYIADEAMKWSGRSAADLVDATTQEVLKLAGVVQ